ncbi:hypothetical protein GCM10025795_39200 [Verticiella sediminum]
MHHQFVARGEQAARKVLAYVAQAYQSQFHSYRLHRIRPRRQTGSPVPQDVEIVGIRWILREC